MILKNIKNVSGRKFFKFKILIFLSFLASLLELFGIATIPFLISSIINPENNPFEKYFQYLSFDNDDFNNYTLNYFLVLLCSIFIIKNLLLIWIYNFEQKLFFEIKVANANSIFNFYIHSELEFFKNKNSSELIRNLVQENTHSCFYMQSLVAIGREFLILILILILLLFNSFSVTFISIFFISLFSIIFYSLFKSQFKSRGIEVQKLRSVILKQLNETFGAIKEIKLLQAENKINNFFNNIVTRLEVNLRFQEFISKLPRPFLEIISIVFLSLLIFYFYMKNYESNKLIFDLTLYSICFLRFIPAFNVITRSYGKLKFLQPSIKLISDEINNIKNFEIKKFEKNKFFKDENKNLTFKKLSFNNVSYKYNNKSIIKKISFEVYRGNKVLITGPSGTGKTTLCDLILDLIDQSEGEIIINDQNDLKKSSTWKKILSYVPQNIFLLDGTISQNLMFDTSIEKFNSKELDVIMKIVCLDKEFEGQLHRNIGEMGVKISGGQKQRLAIGRALIKKPQILILDEATSGINKDIEKKIFENIIKFIPDITILMVTHRVNEEIFFDEKINL